MPNETTSTIIPQYVYLATGRYGVKSETTTKIPLYHTYEKSTCVIHDLEVLFSGLYTDITETDEAIRDFIWNKPDALPANFGSKFYKQVDRQVDTYVCYCECSSWDDSAIWDADSDENDIKKCLKNMDVTGDGSKKNPWRNLCHALYQIGCIYKAFSGIEYSHESCCDIPYIELVVTGTVDYTACPRDVNGVCASFDMYDRLIIQNINIDIVNKKCPKTINSYYNPPSTSRVYYGGFTCCSNTRYHNCNVTFNNVSSAYVKRHLCGFYEGKTYKCSINVKLDEQDDDSSYIYASLWVGCVSLFCFLQVDAKTIGGDIFCEPIKSYYCNYILNITKVPDDPLYISLFTSYGDNTASIYDSISCNIIDKIPTDLYWSVSIYCFRLGICVGTSFSITGDVNRIYANLWDNSWRLPDSSAIFYDSICVDFAFNVNIKALTCELDMGSPAGAYNSSFIINVKGQSELSWGSFYLINAYVNHSNYCSVTHDIRRGVSDYSNSFTNIYGSTYNLKVNSDRGVYANGIHLIANKLVNCTFSEDVLLINDVPDSTSFTMPYKYANYIDNCNFNISFNTHKFNLRGNSFVQGGLVSNCHINVTGSTGYFYTDHGLNGIYTYNCDNLINNYVSINVIADGTSVAWTPTECYKED